MADSRDKFILRELGLQGRLLYTFQLLGDFDALSEVNIERKQKR